MGRRATHDLPQRAEVSRTVELAQAAELKRTGLSGQQASFDVRLFGRTTDDRIERIAVGCEMHADDMGRRPFEIVEPGKHDDWRERIGRVLMDIADRVARLEGRRDSFDPDRQRRTPPRVAWDIHPVAASVLSLWKRLPAMDGSHRLDGAIGRHFRLDAAGGVIEAVVGYGDGIVRLVRAEFATGARLETDCGILTLTFPGALPDALRIGLRRRKPRDIAAELGIDPRSDRVRVKKVKTVDGSTKLTFDDLLVPWDRRSRGTEAWRRTRGAE